MDMDQEKFGELQATRIMGGRGENFGGPSKFVLL
jgi:hypothetical protein